MAYVQWPATLPGPKFPAGPKWGDTRLSSDAESGLRQVRRRFTKARDTVKLTFVLPPPSAYLDFRAFVETNLKDGALWFEAPWLGNLGYEHHAARFSSMPTYRSIDGRVWEAEAEIEIRDAGFADDTGLPSPHHDPNVESGHVSPFENKVYRFYDDFSTYQGWTLEAGSAPTHDAAAGTITLPAGTRISKPLNLDFSDYGTRKLVARMRVKSNGTINVWGTHYPSMFGSFGVFVTDAAGNGYGTRFSHAGTNGITHCDRLDTGTLATLSQTSIYIGYNIINYMTVEVALVEGGVFSLLNYSYGPVVSAEASDSSYTTALRVVVECLSGNCIANLLEVEFS